MPSAYSFIPAALDALALACSGGYSTSPSQTGGTSTPPAQSATVNATAANAFTPATVTVAVGSTSSPVGGGSSGY